MNFLDGWIWTCEFECFKQIKEDWRDLIKTFVQFQNSDSSILSQKQ